MSKMNYWDETFPKAYFGLEATDIAFQESSSGLLLMTGRLGPALGSYILT